MTELTVIQMIQRVNFNRLLNNSKLVYFLLLTIVLFIGCFNLLNTEVKQSIITLVTYPIVLIIILSTILITGYYNISLGILLGMALFVILYPLDNNPMTEPFTQLPSNISTIEGFANNINKTKRQQREHNAGTYTKKKDSRQETINEFKNYFRNIYTEAENDEKEEMKDMIRENLNIKLSNERTNNSTPSSHTEQVKDDKVSIKKGSSNRGSRSKESMIDIIQKNSTPNLATEDSHHDATISSTQLIKLRDFDPASEEDTNLLITKEVLQDMINRITFQYESNDYLKRYMSSRLQEIVKLNKLLTLEDDDE